HHRSHHHGWQIHKSHDGNHTLHPPNTVRFGPARAPDHAPALFEPDTQHGPDPPPTPVGLCRPNGRGST
ncbi:MAG: hypothetical protein OXC00_14295, partial [Acidimicrobiaceae bacterium]|nr:hypothetical protein [Acidimicrobiaceae bacterium]